MTSSLLERRASCAPKHHALHARNIRAHVRNELSRAYLHGARDEERAQVQRPELGHAEARSALERVRMLELMRRKHELHRWVTQ